MADLGTMAAADGARDGNEGPRRQRRITPPRSLPGSRAVVGALLVTAAAVGVFAAYLDATAAPDTQYVVAQTEVPAGTSLSDAADADAIRPEAMDLPPDVADRAYALGEVDSPDKIAGLVTLAPLEAGDLVLETHVGAGGSDEGSQLSFPVEDARALGGGTNPGDRIDVLVTYGSGADTYTMFAARDALVVGADSTAGGLGEATSTITVELERPDALQSLAHAVNAGQIFVVRTTGTDQADGGAGEAPPGYVPPGSGAAVPPDVAADAGADGDAPEQGDGQAGDGQGGDDGGS